MDAPVTFVAILSWSSAEVTGHHLKNKAPFIYSFYILSI